MAKAVDLNRLTQSQAAWLIGRPASWLRDKSHLARRNTDGTYDGRELFRALASTIAPAELPDDDLEGVLYLAEVFAGCCEGSRLGAIRILADVADRHGTPGLATVASELLAALRAAEALGPSPSCLPPTPEVIQARAEAQIAALPEWDARLDLRVVGQCEECKRYRWGRRWLAPPWPRGYVAERTLCPECEKQTSGR